MKQYLTKDGSVRAIDGAPEWVTDLCREMHDDELPNDWRWSVIWEIANAECDFSDEEEVIEFAESLVPIYYSDQFAWYAAYSSRVNYIVNDSLHGENAVMDALRQGIYTAIKGMIDTYLNDDHILFGEVVEAVALDDDEGQCDNCGSIYFLGSDDHDGESGVCWECAQPRPEECLTCGTTTILSDSRGYCSPICGEVKK